MRFSFGTALGVEVRGSDLILAVVQKGFRQFELQDHAVIEDFRNLPPVQLRDRIRQSVPVLRGAQGPGRPGNSPGRGGGPVAGAAAGGGREPGSDGPVPGGAPGTHRGERVLLRISGAGEGRSQWHAADPDHHAAAGHAGPVSGDPPTRRPVSGGHPPVQHRLSPGSAGSRRRTSRRAALPGPGSEPRFHRDGADLRLQQVLLPEGGAAGKTRR